MLENIYSSTVMSQFMMGFIKCTWVDYESVGHVVILQYFGESVCGHFVFLCSDVCICANFVSFVVVVLHLYVVALRFFKICFTLI